MILKLMTTAAIKVLDKDDPEMTDKGYRTEVCPGLGG